MSLLIAVLFGAIVSTATLGTKTQDDCAKFDYQPKACKPAKVLLELGK